MILAGDIGGTKADLALFDDSPRRPVHEGRYLTRDFGSPEALVSAFLNGTPRPTRAVFGVAGTVRDNRCQTSNLPWPLDGAEVGARLGNVQVKLINDLEASAWGLTMLGPSDVEVLQAGVPSNGNRALIAAGTGLGEGVVARLGDRWIPCPSEGGHADFAPRDALQDELLVWLRVRYRRVSFERVLSGPGLADLYRFLSETGRGRADAEVARRFDQAEDPAALVTEAASGGTCGRARMAVEIFTDVYGAEAGNLALKVLAQGGVFVTGGIAPRLLPFFTDGRFVAAFNDKGRLSTVARDMRIAVILDARTGLWGAATYAMTMM